MLNCMCWIKNKIYIKLGNFYFRGIIFLYVIRKGLKIVGIFFYIFGLVVIYFNININVISDLVSYRFLIMIFI